MAGRPQGKFVTVKRNDTEVAIHYYEFGQGGRGTVVFIHTGGAATSAWMCWSPNLEAFAKAGYHVYAPDSVGYGLTELGTGEGRLGGPDFIAAFIDALGIQSAHFIGNSGGAMGITRFAMDNANRVKSFITSGGEPRVETEESKAIAPRLGQTARMDFVREMLSKPEVTFADMRKATADFYYDPNHPSIDAVAQLRLEDIKRPGVQERERDGAFRQITGGRSNITAADLSRIEAPTYLLHGRDERFFFAADDAPHLIEAAAKPVFVIPNCRSTLLPFCGHWPQLEAADTYNALCLEFLGSIDG